MDIHPEKLVKGKITIICFPGWISIQKNKSKEKKLLTFFLDGYLSRKISHRKKNLHLFLKRITVEQQAYSYNEKTFDSDISVFFRNYLKPEMGDVKNIEDEFSALFSDLNLLRIEGKRDVGNKNEEFYTLERSEKNSLPIEIILFAIVSNKNLGGTISFNELAYGYNSVGNVFLLSRDGLMEKIKQLVIKYDFITFSQSGGNQVLIINEKPDVITILNEYYGK